MTIGIMGTPVNCGNQGVAALGASLVNLCAGSATGAEVVLMLGNKDNEPAKFWVNGQPRLIPVANCRMSPRSKWRDHLFWIVLLSLLYRLVPISGVRKSIARSVPWIRTLVEADFVGDVRGGDSFSDIYGLRGFVMGCLYSWTAVLVKGSVVQFPQTYGPYSRSLARWIATYLLRRSSIIIARDKESLAVAQQLAGPGREVMLSPDVAFSLEAIRPESVEVDAPLAFGTEVPLGIVGLNINGLMYHGGYTRNNMFGLKLDYAAFLPRLITALLQEVPEVWLVPHTYALAGDVESDNDASLKVRALLAPELRHRVRCIVGQYDAHQLKWIIGRSEFFIGSRMHSCIAALSQGVPCAGVAYSRKFEGVFDSVGVKDWVIDARTATVDEAVASVVGLYRRRAEVRSELAKRAHQAREKLAQIFSRLVSLKKT